MKVRSSMRKCTVKVSLHEQSSCCPPDGPAWQQTTSREPQTAASPPLDSLHNPDDLVVFPQHDRLAACIKAAFGFDIEPTVGSHDARPRFGHVWAIFLNVVSETVTYIDFNQKANLQCFGLTYFIFHILLQLAVNILVNPGSSPVYELELKSGHCLHSQQCNF